MDKEKQALEIAEEYQEHKDESSEGTDLDHIDLSNFTKEDLVKFVEDLNGNENYNKNNALLKQARNQFDHILEFEKADAKQKFVEGGGEEGDFEFRKDKVAQKFEKIFDAVKDKISSYYHNLEKEKEKNLATKEELLEKLRNLMSQEETTNSINILKDIQDEWKKIGQVPAGKSQTIWANYNALIERFYNNRSIYFELKELDRKKNLESKKEIIEKAEKLVEVEPFTKAIKELKQLHEDYKHIGPVPREEQEALWNRFKTASDNVYEKRNSHLETIKHQQEANYQVKSELAEKATTLSQFTSDRIDDWKLKTAEVLALQETWKKAGGLPPDKAKEVSKKFWGACKTYFHHKDRFFKGLEAKKEENLKLKIEICEKAEQLKESEDFGHTASALKDLQKQWDAIGPVPIKQKDSIFKRFKAACDYFFNRKRAQVAETEKEFVENLKKKSIICEKIEQLAASTQPDVQALKALQQEWREAGFVPKSEMQHIQAKYNTAINHFLQKIGGAAATVTDDKGGRGSHSRNEGRDLHKKEGSLGKRIHALKSDIDHYSTNIEFLGHSKNADILKKEIQQKIDAAKEELKGLETQMKIIKSS